ncbi:MAG: hypothetical protein AB1779_06990 [Candidatus Thermoplasmatota archaeon]
MVDETTIENRCPTCGSELVGNVCKECGYLLPTDKEFEEIEEGVEDETVEGYKRKVDLEGVEEFEEVRPEYRGIYQPPIMEKKKTLEETRNKAMFISVCVLVILGVSNFFLEFFGLIFVIVYANLFTLGGLIFVNIGLLATSMEEMSYYEGRNMRNAAIGLVFLLLIPFHEAYNIFPLGFYTPPWHPLNFFIGIIGVALISYGIFLSKESTGFFSIYFLGLFTLFFCAIDNFINQYYPLLDIAFHNIAMISIGSTIIIISFLMYFYRNVQVKALEKAMSYGNLLYDSKQYSIGIEQFDNAIILSHSLYSHLLHETYYDVYSQRLQSKIPKIYIDPWVKKGEGLVKLGKNRKAMAIFDMLIEIAPSCDDAWYYKGIINARIGKRNEAKACFESAIAINQNNINAIEALRAMGE